MDLPGPGIELASLALQADSLPTVTSGMPRRGGHCGSLESALEVSTKADLLFSSSQLLASSEKLKQCNANLLFPEKPEILFAIFFFNEKSPELHILATYSKNSQTLCKGIRHS